VLFILGDTSVWLVLAKDLNGQKLIVAIRVLVHEGRACLLAPQIVLDEFDGNRERVEADMARSLRSHIRLVRGELERPRPQVRPSADNGSGSPGSESRRRKLLRGAAALGLLTPPATCSPWLSCGARLAD
jgi:hypothetical protein